MPAITIWMIRCSLIFFITTFLIGSVLLLNKAFGWSPALWILLPVHIEVAILGWILQFVMGTAYWMFPRHVRGAQRGNKGLALAMVITLNTGILLSAIAVTGQWVLLAGRFFLFAGVVLFARLMWGRVVSYRDL